MNIEQKKWTKATGWETLRNDNLDYLNCNLVIAFGSREILSDSFLYESIKSSYPNANILMNSTSGEIIDRQVNDETISLTAIEFEKTKIKTAITHIGAVRNSFEAGYFLARALDPVNLANVLVISDGQKVNGSDLVLGLQEFLPKDTIITGGLAGDGDRFQKTLVGLNESPNEGRIVAIGFYGKNLTVTHGSVSGWDSFGPERLITKSKGNLLSELDGQPALDIYKKYLGEYADELPGSGLLFPLSIRKDENSEAIVRTILSIDEDAKSLRFAGNMPEGFYARLMNANFDRLIEGATNAAINSMKNILQKPDLAILISCVGRKLVLNQRIEEEVEGVKAIFGDTTAITGFYSYGEISPSFNFNKCELHNQTMTITTLSETN
ncbi:MAG TPA: FIST N-terminal domain-containing protein [Bacteroidia bacterium]|nr:FIST N-terminal domain-containing protein [Bacteroidia bacterium]